MRRRQMSIAFASRGLLGADGQLALVFAHTEFAEWISECFLNLNFRYEIATRMMGTSNSPHSDRTREQDDLHRTDTLRELTSAKRRRGDTAAALQHE